MSLQNPAFKMSKSHSDPKTRILITDSPDEIRKKIMSALTDSVNSVSYDPRNRPGVSNLLQILSHFDTEGRSAEDLGLAYSNLTLRELKTLVSDNIARSLLPIRKRYEEVMAENNGAYIDHVQAKGAEKARESAEEMMSVIREKTRLHGF